MTTATQEKAFTEYTEVLLDMANTLRSITAETPGIEINALLELAGAEFGTTPSQMKYALSFAGVKKLVKIDYNTATVSAA